MGKEVMVSQPISATCEHLIDKNDFISIMLITLMAIVAIFLDALGDDKDLYFKQIYLDAHIAYWCLCYINQIIFAS